MARLFNFSRNTFISWVGNRNTVAMSTSSNSELVEIISNLKNGDIQNTGKSFRIMLNESQYAEILYEKQNNTYDLQHTSIPENFQGKGLGSVVAERIFRHIIAEDDAVKMILSCEYLQHYQSKNKKEYGSYITK